MCTIYGQKPPSISANFFLGFSDLCDRGEIFFVSNRFVKTNFIIKMNGKAYEIVPDRIDFANRKIPLKEVDASHISPWGFNHNGLNYERLRFSKESPNPSFPKPCLYITDRRSYCSDCRGNHIINVQYINPTTLVGTKITGDASVPSGRPNIRLNLRTRQFDVRFAWRGYKNSYWNSNVEQFQSATTHEIHSFRPSNGLNNPNIHISQFKPIYD